jgi:GNAT superfamily N-acetyltransferase
VDIDVYPVGKAAWRIFAPHHYLNASHMAASSSFGLFIDDECVAYTSYRQFVHGTLKNVKIGHRLVVLPDWQGLGLGMVLANWTGQYLYDKGWRFRAIVAHPAMIHAFSRSPRWQLVTAGAKSLRSSTPSPTLTKAQTSTRRFNTYSFEYRPPAAP